MNHRTYTIYGLLLVLAVLLSACAPRVAATPKPATVTPIATATLPAEGIHWREWEPETFALAQAQDKLILLDLNAVWCHWCHVMDATTYSDPVVSALINSAYIPVRVDTDQRPDVQARYLVSGWPTTAFLTPQGDILTAYSYVAPDEMRSLLQQVNVEYATHKDDIAARLAETHERQATSRPAPITGVPTKTIEFALARLAGTYNAANGGFGREPKFPQAGAISLILRYNTTAQGAEWHDRVIRTLDGTQHLVDPVWGGLYRYSVTADWQTPHYEKMLSSNAQGLQSYLEAYQATGKTSYRSTAESILRYVEHFLSDPSGGFYGSQDADLVEPGTRKILMEGEKYFALSDKERLALGVPHTDQNLYVNWNGEMIVAMLQAAAVLEQPRYQKTALAALDRLWTQGRGPGGQMWHSLRPDGSIASPRSTLADQTQFGLALLAAYSATGQRRYLSQAEELAGYALNSLRDTGSGGFFDLPADPTATGALAMRDTPCPDNVIAARFFIRLFRHTDKVAYRDAAEGALKLCGVQMGDNADYALAADDVLTYPLTLVVVGTPAYKTTDALLSTANRFYRPGKVVTSLDPALGPAKLGELTYPTDRIAIYACAGRRCSSPVQDPKDLANQVTLLFSDQR